jgi:hypothetical protein
MHFVEDVAAFAMLLFFGSLASAYTCRFLWSHGSVPYCFSSAKAPSNAQIALMLSSLGAASFALEQRFLSTADETLRGAAASTLSPYAEIIRGVDALASGANLTRLNMEAMWSWRPLGRASLLSADSFRDGASFHCAGEGQCALRLRGNCSGHPCSVAVGAGNWVALIAEMRADNTPLPSLVWLPSDISFSQQHLDSLSQVSQKPAAFCVNIAPDLVSPRVFAIPIGVEQVLYSRGRHPGMYMHQATGPNLAAKLCWSAVLASELAERGSVDFPLLYMNFRTTNNIPARSYAHATFALESWAIDHVDLPFNWGEQVPKTRFEDIMLPMLVVMWGKAHVAKAPWFLDACGAEPRLPSGISPDLVQTLGLPGYPHFLEKLALSPFVLAPEGFGIATHRAWEALYCGSIPVILEVGNAMDEMYAGLPVMMVDAWEEATPTTMICFAAELLLKASGFLMDATPLEDRDEAYYRKALLAPLGRPSADLCAPALANYSQRHSRTHPGYISLNSLDYRWWRAFMDKKS